MIRFEPVLALAQHPRPDAGSDSEALAAPAREAAERAERDARAAEHRRVVAAAWEVGYRDGWAAAQADVKARLEQPMIALADGLREKLATLDRLMDECQPALTQAIVGHAVRLAEALTGAPAVIDRKALQQRLIVAATAERGPDVRLVCRGHPTTLADLAEVLQRADCTAQPDPAMAAGGIEVFLTEPATNRRVAEWDASVESQIAALRAQFGDDHAHQPG